MLAHTHHSHSLPRHQGWSRRVALQAGSIGLLGLGMNHLDPLRAAAPNEDRAKAAKNVIYIFLSGGLGQHDSFDLKPNAPKEVRGEFNPISTKTPGIHICEHLPGLAKRSEDWALVRSLTHPYIEHSEGHHVMLTGRTPKPLGFNASKPRPSDFPSIAAVANDRLQPRNNLPPAIVLPDKIVHRTGRTIPGQFAGQMGELRDPWFLEASPYHPEHYGAYPDYLFHHAKGGMEDPKLKFQAPNLSLPHGLAKGRFVNRMELFNHLNKQRAFLEKAAEVEQFDRYRQMAVSLLSDEKTQKAFDVMNVDEKRQEAYGKNSFGWSLLMSAMLVESGVSLVQVNLGNNECWDTHGNAFPHLKDYLFPPTDQAVSALLDDLKARGLLEDTLIVMAGEFGRTPKISLLPKHYKKPGRDHWGAVQTVFFAGGGVKGGNVIGSSDKLGGYPASDPQTPENMAATIYQTLGIPSATMWRDAQDRPHKVYHGEPVAGLMG
ncbi:MAG: hypothetical protein CMO66_02970 [Verrucomicrobiales bacterium]|nr:hypothetical protein [Verrucomicrobiales bacterium]